MKPTYRFEAAVWRYNGKDPWYFVTLPSTFADEIKQLTDGLPNKGFGTVKVEATIDDTTWQTSIFPDKKSGSYLMPVKKDVRSVLQVSDGDTVAVSVTLINL